MNWDPWVIWLLVVFIACYIFVAHLRTSGMFDDEQYKNSDKNKKEQ